MTPQHNTSSPGLLPAGNVPAGTLTIQDLIDEHRAAVMADEANFDEAGNALDVVAAETSATVELAAFRKLAAVQCLSHEDVQAKLDYFINGSIGMRDKLCDCLIDYGDDVLPSLLSSLLIKPTAA